MGYYVFRRVVVRVKRLVGRDFFGFGDFVDGVGI